MNPRTCRDTHTRSGVALLGFLALLIAGCEGTTNAADHSGSTAGEAAVEVTVVRVIDGDTIAVEPTDDLEATNDAGDEHSVRVLGIDAAEMNFYSDESAECGAEAATSFITDQVAEGDTVDLIFDSESDEMDRFGRSLAYIETTDGTDIGQALIYEGLAWAWHPASAPEPSRHRDYTEAQEQAEEEPVGAWQHCPEFGEE